MDRRRSDRVDEYARQVTRLEPDQVAVLTDPEPRRALFERIVRMPTAGAGAEPATRRRALLTAATAGVGIAAVASGVVASGVAVPGVFRPQDRPPSAVTVQPPPAPPSTGPRGELFPDHAASCALRYGPADLAKAEFAFDGTVTGIGTSPVDDPAWPADGGPNPYVPVTFAVNRWYRGGDGPTITVAMLPPNVLNSTQLDTQAPVSYQVGSRLLVSGGIQSGTGRPWRYPLAWSCGLTRWYTAEDALLWEDVFSER